MSGQSATWRLVVFVFAVFLSVFVMCSIRGRQLQLLVLRRLGVCSSYRLGIAESIGSRYVGDRSGKAVLSELLSAHDQIDEALHGLYSRRVDEDPQSAALRLLRGRIRLRQGDLVGAESDFVRSRELLIHGGEANTCDITVSSIEREIQKIRRLESVMAEWVTSKAPIKTGRE